MDARPHEKLEVYRMAHALAIRVHVMSLRLPKWEMFEEGSQVRRSSKSVGSQIVEGHALRQYRADYSRYLIRAYASAEENFEHLRNLLETGSAGQVREECVTLLTEYATLCRKLFNYVQTVRSRHSTQPRTAGDIPKLPDCP